MTLDAELELALRAARVAAELTLRSFGGTHEVTHKSPGQPLTAADLEANAAIEEILRGARPDYGWLSEETADRPARLERERVWVVDPIDGTRSFIAGYPEYSISIALVETGRPLLGVVAVPPTHDVFWAVEGGGAFRQRADGTARVRLRVVEPGAEVRVLASRSEIRAGEFDGLPGGWALVPCGSTANKMARLAAGAGDVFVSRGPKSEWDVCAGALIVHEAGGRVTDLGGHAIGYNRPDPAVRGVVVATPGLHAAALRFATPRAGASA